MILPKVGETWTGLYKNEYTHTFKVINIIPIRDFMENEAVKLEGGEHAKYVPNLREKIASGDYDKYGNVYIIHYSDLEYTGSAYNILLESELFVSWKNLQIAA